MVVAIYKMDFKGQQGMDKFEVNATETTVFRKKDGAWKVIHCHTSNILR